MGQFSWHALLTIDRASVVPVFLQITNAIIREIRQGRIRPGNKLPGARALASMLEVNKKTVEKVYEELELQEWLSVLPKSGSYVSSELPDLRYQEIRDLEYQTLGETTSYRLADSTVPKTPKYNDPTVLSFNDGFPDPRLVDHNVLARGYRRTLGSKNQRTLLSYSDPYGDGILREVLAKYLNETRGIRAKTENLLITRGGQMGLYLSIKILLGTGALAIITNPSYFGANQLLRFFGAQMMEIPVDDQGMVVEEIGKHCKKGRSPRLVYITPHHHHPTTVTLSSSRRMELLKLAEKYRFAIIEDDYDYDFHYAKSPIMPISSMDTQGNVVYVGSFSKTIAPSIRIGYLVAPKNFIDQAARLRRIIDHQGDLIMERTLAGLLDQGEIQRMLRRSRKVYQQRRDYFCNRLEVDFGDSIDFERPQGGMAVWARFNSAMDLNKIVADADRKKLYMHTTERFVTDFNAIRMGFASLNLDEIDRGLQIIKGVMGK